MTGFRLVWCLRAYSGGTVPGSHRVPYSPTGLNASRRHLNAYKVIPILPHPLCFVNCKLSPLPEDCRPPPAWRKPQSRTETIPAEISRPCPKQAAWEHPGKSPSARTQILSSRPSKTSVKYQSAALLSLRFYLKGTRSKHCPNIPSILWQSIPEHTRFFQIYFRKWSDLLSRGGGSN